MPTQLSPGHRNALFQRVLLDLDDFSDLMDFVAQGKLEDAYRHGRRIADGFRLLADGGLGWERRRSEATTLTLPPSELRRIAGRMRDEANAEWDSTQADRDEAETEWSKVCVARDACTSILDQL